MATPAGQTPWVRAWIGLGSNLDDPPSQLAQALRALAGLADSRLAVVSPAYRSAALRSPGDLQPQPDYLNAVAGLDTCLSPLALLDGLQAIEGAQLRIRDRRWGPRTIDLDLLLYGQVQLDTPRLTLPHPGIGGRAFVLRPLHDVAPALVLPDGSAVATLLAACPEARQLHPAGALAAEPPLPG